MKIYLDDLRTPPDDTWNVVRNYNDFVNLFNQNYDNVEAISFDHDLGDDPKSGYDAAKYVLNFIVDKKRTVGEYKQFPMLTVHSMNPVGARNIMHTIYDIENILSDNINVY